MAQLNVNFDKITGPVKAMHSVGQPPWLGMGGDYLHYLTEANIPYSRLHDMGGIHGLMIYVDIPNIFRDFDSDPENPENYDFAFTDVLISKMIENKIEPIYRLGVTIENYPQIKRYRTFPPADYDKWAKICEMIIRHYNCGWANGFEYGITYWEIWNEPDNNIPNPELSMMWSGTAEEYFSLYATAAKHLKNCFGSSIKVGGYASSGLYTVIADPENYGIAIPNTGNKYDAYRSAQFKYFITFFVDFLDYIKEHNAPLDFFSWHSYASVEHNLAMERFAEETLEKKGFGDAEIHLNEWNNAYQRELRGTSYASANAAAMMCAMHSTKADVMCYYDARIASSMYGGLFDANFAVPVSTYYSFKAFGELYALGNCVESSVNGVYALAAVSDDGTKKAVLVTNTGEDTVLNTNLKDMQAYLIEKDIFLEETKLDLSAFKLGKNQTLLIKNY